MTRSGIDSMQIGFACKFYSSSRQPASSVSSSFYKATKEELKHSYTLNFYYITSIAKTFNGLTSSDKGAIFS